MKRGTSIAGRRTPGGFTLLELMVSLTVGGIAITSIYAIGSASTRVFHQQHQLASAQTALRLAMNQVKRDIARAGYLATPGIDQPGQSCAPVGAPLHDPSTGSDGKSGRIAAISFFDNDVDLAASGAGAVDPTGQNTGNGFTVDDLVLMGNYATANEYSGASAVLGVPTQLHISPNWYAFHRDFTNWYSEIMTPVVQKAALDRAFPTDRLIRIRTATGLVHFAQVVRVAEPRDGDPTMIEFDPALPENCAAAATGAWVAPVSAIRYVVRNAPAAERADDWAETTGPMAQLIREEVQPVDKRTPLFAVDANGRGQGTRAMLDYVVGFNLSFAMTAAGAIGVRDTYVPGRTIPRTPDNSVLNGEPTQAQDDADELTVNRNPERVRSVVIDLAVRAPEQDPTFRFANCKRMRCFQVFPATGATARPGAARVRRLRAEVFVPNIAFEGY